MLMLHTIVQHRCSDMSGNRLHLLLYAKIAGRAIGKPVFRGIFFEAKPIAHCATPALREGGVHRGSAPERLDESVQAVLVILTETATSVNCKKDPDHIHSGPNLFLIVLNPLVF